MATVPPHLGRLLIEIHSVGVLPSALGVQYCLNVHFSDRRSQFGYATNDQFQKESVELISNCNLTQVQSATSQCKNRTGGTAYVAATVTPDSVAE